MNTVLVVVVVASLGVPWPLVVDTRHAISGTCWPVHNMIGYGTPLCDWNKYDFSDECHRNHPHMDNSFLIDGLIGMSVSESIDWNHFTAIRYGINTKHKRTVVAFSLTPFLNFLGKTGFLIMLQYIGSLRTANKKQK